MLLLKDLKILAHQNQLKSQSKITILKMNRKSEKHIMITNFHFFMKMIIQRKA